MTLAKLFSRIVPAIESAQVPYMLTGSVASSLYGTPRSTLDLDIVIAPTREQLLDMVRRLSDMDYYADEQQALEAFSHRSQFNVIDNVTNWKVDFIFREDSEYGVLAFKRQTSAVVAGENVRVSSPEDVLLAKLRWMKISDSDRQLRDVIGIVVSQGTQLDNQYVAHWVSKLGLEKEWDTVRREAPNHAV